MPVISRLKPALILAGLMLPTAAYAAHWDRPSCYIDVHSGCFVNQKTPCTNEEYKDFLRMCDDTYPAATPPKPKRSLKSNG
ncbi:MAG: hypothetical protein IOC86_15595 [Aestuariivirga sp.]|nr:hypothetical protein [Aestuariivirga sp.]